jgi:hypothetical protein
MCSKTQENCKDCVLERERERERGKIRRRNARNGKYYLTSLKCGQYYPLF